MYCSALGNMGHRGISERFWPWRYYRGIGPKLYILCVIIIYKIIIIIMIMLKNGFEVGFYSNYTYLSASGFKLI
jgi:hypothetical protein